jgi:hypothetical protein
MPNIIEQQDLLKGLPDTRLAMLLQNPMGDIPPFLVAAEAQRRQAIRQQFAGSEGKESVVDTLTKQLANVPQNIGSKSSPTEAPDLKGILEKSEEIQDQISSQQEKDAGQSMASGGVVRRFAEGGIANLAPKGTYYGFTPGVPTETALGSLARASSVIPRTMGVMPGNIGYQARPTQPQGMRAGGMVQRYQSQGLVTPTVDSLAASISGMSLEEYKRKLEQEKIAKLGRGKARYLLENPTVPTSEAEKAEQEFYAATEGPFSGFYSPESAYAAAQELAKNNERDSRVFPKLPAGAAGGMNFAPAPPKESAAPVETPPPEPGETQDEYRARLEKLLAAQQPSDWEKAQGYFAMAEQFLDPSKTTMQSLAGAGQAFAQSAGEQARAQREADLARERGLLEYDMGERNRIREAQAAERERTSLSADQQANILVKSQESVRRVIDSKREQLAKLTSDPLAAGLDPTISTRAAALEKEIARDEERLMNIEGALAALGEQAYGPIPFEPYSLRSGFSR